MSELEILLENFWIVKEKNPELYHTVKDAIPSFRDFVEDKLGFRLIVNPWLIKLEKLPGRAESWMGVPGFQSTTEYGMLCLLLAFLEDRGPGDQFVLSQVTEFIASEWPGRERIDWTLYQHRRMLVRVLRFASEYELLRVDDGDDSKFMDAADTEVLYESTGISRYFVRNFTTNIMDCNNRHDIETSEWLEADKDRGRIRRNRVYRRLVLSPAVYNEGDEDADYAYIKNFKNLLQKDFDEKLGTALHVHRNGAFLVPDMTKHWKDVFPDGSTRSNIVLQINREIVDRVESHALERGPDDIITVSRAYFENLIEFCRSRFSHGWSKEYREMGTASLCANIIDYMDDFSMLRQTDEKREIQILPLCGKVVGSYSGGFSSRHAAGENEVSGEDAINE